MADFFNTIGQALLRELRSRRLARAPVGLIVHIDDWICPNPRFEVWPCPGNSKRAWGTRNRAHVSDFDGMCITLNYVHVVASHAQPCSTDAPVVGPEIDLFHRFFARRGDIPIADALTRVWPKLPLFPNMALDADYTMVNTAGLRTSVYITFLTRFGQEIGQEYRNLNTHLLDMVPFGSIPTVSVKRKWNTVEWVDEEEVEELEHRRRKKKVRKDQSDSEEDWR